jgi:hypothetical protein
MSSCAFAASPPLNTDIAGIGVRISTYAQAFLVGELRFLSLVAPYSNASSCGYHRVAFD